MSFAFSKFGRCFSLAMALLLLSSNAVGEAETVRVGVFSFQGDERAESYWVPTFHHLRAVLPQYRFQIIPGDLKKLTAAVADNQLDFIITNPGHYVELEATFGASRIATVQFQSGPDPDSVTGAAVFTSSSRADVATLSDLRGKRLAAAAADSFSFRQAWRELLVIGVDPFSDIGKLVFVGFPAERVIEAVRDGSADVGVVRNCVIEGLIAEGRVKADEFKVISTHLMPALGCKVSTRLYPDWPFIKLSRTSSVLAKKIAQALLSMPPNANHQNWTVPVDYHSVNELYQELKIGPYEDLGRQSLANILWQYRYWLTLLALTFAWWVFHVFRVKHLIRKRTEELLKANNEVRIKKEELEHASRLSLLGEMAASLAHELNQPLAAIANYSRGCERRLEQGGALPEIFHGLQQVTVQAERAGEIIRNMRSFVRKRQPDLRRISPELLVTDALKLFSPLVERNKVRIVFEPSNPLPEVNADKLQLEEVLLNLLQNAVDATEGVLEGVILIQAALINGMVEVSVTDNGAGLNDDAMSRLFETFYTTKPQGLGLGLSLSRNIVESHGGRLWAEKIQGGGASFHLALPLAEEKEKND
ncbi:MAG: PhnD/SsuA/transferrin family substrate-binding protein [Gallionellaceae bacterium]